MSEVEKFGKYLLLEKIAVGGMAEVYLAKSSGANGVNKFVAIKRILPQYSNNPEFITMFKEEAKVAINLSHSNIVSIYDFGMEDNQFYLVMEFVEGRNLRQIINEMKKFNKSFSIDQAVYIIKEAAAGLNHAHRCTDSQSGKPLNITHRDMSPQNIMISFEGEAKVIDFGIAKAETENEATKAGTLKGKFSYMSPEQSEGYPIDPRTDVFALGIILWELLANDRLFTGSNEGAILRKVRDCQIPAIRKINPLVPQELERIVMKALAKDKNVRYQTAANFHKDLNLFLNTQYPDFSVHDFSFFIRECFKTAYNEGKEKLITYSKIEAPIEPAPPVSAAINEKNNLVKDAPANRMNAKDFLQPEKPQGMKPETKEKIVLDGLRSAGVQKKLGPQDPRQTTFTGTAYNPQKAQSRKNHKNNNFDVVPKIAIICLLIYAGWYGFNNFSVSNKKVKQIASAKKSTPVETGSIDMSATAATKLSVISEPSGAKIYIDGADTQQYTPAIVAITANKDINITLVKDGYYKYQTVKLFKEASTLSANLIPTPTMAYINIYVVNGGENPVIYINGNRLSEKPPVNQYAVPANSDIEIYAVNPFTNLSDKVKIKLTANKTENIQLILGRKPSNKVNR